MSSNMELGVWGDGTIRLAFWDYTHGADVVLVLNEDGTAAEASPPGDDGEETLRPVDAAARSCARLGGLSDD